jgi:hypothetical protein
MIVRWVGGREADDSAEDSGVQVRTRELEQELMRSRWQRAERGEGLSLGNAPPFVLVGGRQPFGGKRRWRGR